MISDHHIWHAQVRSHELDNQNIVNNAVYMQYFANARLLYLNELGVNWDEWQKKGIDLVLYKAEIIYRNPLHAFSKFRIETSYSFIGRAKIKYTQKLYNEYDKLCTECETISVCVDQKTKKVIVPKEIMECLLNKKDTVEY